MSPNGNAELTCRPDEIVRECARRMLLAALEAEVDGYVSASSTSSTTGATGW